ncbi:MAG: hypothetical protein PVF44_17230, partial [Syntrophobacterales bacterium]
MARKAWEIVSRVLNKWRLHYHVYLSLLAILIGILAAYGALLFRFAIKFTQYCFYQDARDILAFADTLPTYLIIALPALG